MRPISTFVVLTVQLWASNLTLTFGSSAEIEKMIKHDYSYRYYYGPLSGWRDGRVMGCRELIN